MTPAANMRQKGLSICPMVKVNFTRALFNDLGLSIEYDKRHTVMVA